MLDIGWTELLLIGVVALIVVGPKDLPHLFHSLGRITAKARGMAREFSSAMEDAAKGSGLDEAAGTLRDVKNMTSKRALGLDALDRATERFEKWDPKRPLAGQGAAGTGGFSVGGNGAGGQVVPDPAAPSAVADASIMAPEGPAHRPTPPSGPTPAPGPAPALGPTPAPGPAPDTGAARPAVPSETAANGPRRRLHAVRRSDTKDQ